MQHEKVVRAGDGVSPLPNPSVDHGFRRAAYCSPEVRSRRLACAHTAARSKLAERLDAIPPSVIDPGQLQQWKAELSEVDLAIIQVDWRKSDAEIDHAAQSAAVLTRPEDPARREVLRATEARLELLDQEHCGQIDRLARLLEGIGASLDAFESR